MLYKPRSVEIALPACRVYISDLRAIVQILSRYSPVPPVIEVDHLVLESFEELAALDLQNPQSVRIVLKEPSIQVRFGRSFAATQISAEDAEKVPLGLRDELVEVAQRCRRPFVDRFATGKWLTGAGLLIFAAVMAAAAVLGEVAPTLLIFIFIAAVALYITFAAWAMRMHLQRFSVIVLEERSRSGSYWRRHEPTLTAMMAAIAGSLVTLFVQWLFGFTSP